MAKNRIQDGDVLNVAMPYDRTSGQGVKIGSIVGVCQIDALNGAEGEVALTGVWEVAKVSAQAWAVGDAIYWDDTAKNFTTVSSGNTKAGVATAIATNPTPTGYLRLNGSF